MKIDGTTSPWLDRVRAPLAEPFEPGSTTDVVIAGAGLTGMATAVMLARAGRRVTVLEARSLGAVTTGNTTGKISLLQGALLSGIRAHHPDSLAAAYLQANAEGKEWLLGFCATHGVDVQHKDAYSYAQTDDGTATARAEFEAGDALGLAVEWRTDVPLPFETFGAAVLRDQAQFDSLDALEALAVELKSLGGRLVEGVRVTGVDSGSPCVVGTDLGDMNAAAVVLATGVPILDRGLYFAKVAARRSYGLAFRAPGPLPDGMFVSVDAPTRSVRTAPHDGEELLVIGGNGHAVGRHPSPRSLVDDLTAWTVAHFPGAERSHSWSAQDYVSANSIPFVGTLPGGHGAIYLATGYAKWGMTNAVAAGLRITAEIVGDEIAWAKKLGHRATRPADLAIGAKENAVRGGEMTAGWVRAEVTTLPDDAPAEGTGVVGSRGVAPVAVSTVDGVTCAVSAICPHLEGIVTWNDAERSWDCPLHGSRFAADGALLEGPSTKGLSPVEL